MLVISPPFQNVGGFTIARWAYSSSGKLGSLEHIQNGAQDSHRTLQLSHSAKAMKGVSLTYPSVVRGLTSLTSD